MTSWFLAGLLCLGAFVQPGETRILLVASPYALAAHQSSARVASAGPTPLAVQLGVLFSDWKGVPRGEMDTKVPDIKARIDAALTTYVAGRLEETPRPAALDVQDDLNKAMATATWESVFGLSQAEVAAALNSNASRPLAYVVEGSGPVSDLYASAFAIGYGNVFSTRVHAFRSTGGKCRAVNPGDSPLDGAVSGAVRLTSFAAPELRLLVWSQHIGSPEGLTTIALYRFDGNALQTLWKNENVPAAKVTLQEGLVVIESHSHAFTKDGTVFSYDRRFYQQVAGGLEQVKITQWTER